MFASECGRILKIFVLVYFLKTSNAALGPPLNSFGVGNVPKCEPSVTTASGSFVSHKGNLINFSNINNSLRCFTSTKLKQFTHVKGK